MMHPSKHSFAKSCPRSSYHHGPGMQMHTMLGRSKPYKTLLPRPSLWLQLPHTKEWLSDETWDCMKDRKYQKLQARSAELREKRCYITILFWNGGGSASTA